MDSEIDFDFSPVFILYKNGRFKRLPEQPNVPPSEDPQNVVVSKDIVISPETNLSLRIFLPHKILENNNNKKKLPLLVYFHGGCFFLHTAFNQIYNTFATSAVLATDCIAVSVDYRRAPEHPIPTAYEDSWEALKWVFSHINESGPEPWLNQYADFNKVFLAGDSAGANISHHLTIKAGTEKSEGIKILGIILVHPYFWSKTPIDEEDTKDVNVRRMYEKLWEVASPNSEEGVDDPWFNVVGSDTDISGLGCERVLVMVAGKDVLVRQGLGYVKKLEKSGWGGKVEVFESEGEIHVFHLKNPDSENARKFVERFAEFVKAGTN